LHLNGKSLQAFPRLAFAFAGGISSKEHLYTGGKVATVKIDEEHKRKLERYVASHLLKRGKKISMQRVLGAMVDHALECEKFAQTFEKLPPLEEDPAWIMLQNPKNWGVRDASEKIDEHVYGE
jgi:hypothetical protein